MHVRKVKSLYKVVVCVSVRSRGSLKKWSGHSIRPSYAFLCHALHLLPWRFICSCGSSQCHDRSGREIQNPFYQMRSKRKIYVYAVVFVNHKICYQKVEMWSGEERINRRDYGS